MWNPFRCKPKPDPRSPEFMGQSIKHYTIEFACFDMTLAEAEAIFDRAADAVYLTGSEQVCGSGGPCKGCDVCEEEE